MNIDFRDLDKKHLEAAARHYEEHGYFILTGVEEALSARFRPILADLIGVDSSELEGLFAPDRPLGILPSQLRRKLARVETSDALADTLVNTLEPIIRRLIGPVVQVSSTFHAQIKGAPLDYADHGGAQHDYLEVHVPFQLHQDFTGATIPTSPSAVTLWVALNTAPDWNLRLYPGSHRYGMLCNRFIDLADPRLAALGKPLDIQARAGTAVLFNAMLLHGTSNPGPTQRVSCDIRFFPRCGFLPSQPRPVGNGTGGTMAELLPTAPGPTLRAPLLETQIYMGIPTALESAPEHSVLNWVNCVNCLVEGNLVAALPHLERFTNRVIGLDPPEVYVSKFLRRPTYQQRPHGARECLHAVKPRSDLETVKS